MFCETMAPEKIIETIDREILEKQEHKQHIIESVRARNDERYNRAYAMIKANVDKVNLGLVTEREEETAAFLTSVTKECAINYTWARNTFDKLRAAAPEIKPVAHDPEPVAHKTPDFTPANKIAPPEIVDTRDAMGGGLKDEVAKLLAPYAAPNAQGGYAMPGDKNLAQSVLELAAKHGSTPEAVLEEIDTGVEEVLPSGSWRPWHNSIDRLRAALEDAAANS